MQKPFEKSTQSSFVTLPNGNETITVLADPKRHVHPIRLLQQYCEGHPITRKNNDKTTIENELKTNSGLLIILTEKFEQMPESISKIIATTSSSITGTAASSATATTIATATINTKDQKEMAEGAFLIKTAKINKASVLLIVGGGIAGVVYAINELGLKYLTGNSPSNDSNSISIPTMDVFETPTLAYRIFFTWDHSTNWDVENSGQQEIGFANPYLKTKEAFLRDYKRVIDFMSLNRINGLIIYGFLRDSHGGIEAAHELCQYANERGVRIIPGVGINAYGAVYWEGEHEYNLSNWLNKHPELSATFEKPKTFGLTDFAPLYIPKTHYLDALCPSKPANAEFNIKAIQWLAKTFEIGGINFESGDYGTCQCKDCVERRAKDKQWSHEDMASLYPKLFSAAKESRPELWTICEAYWDNILNLEALEPLKKVPQNAVFQYCTNRGYLVDQVFKQLTQAHVTKVPGNQKILRTHMGSQWQNERYTLVAERYAKMMQVAYNNGMHGATIFGEPSDYSVVNEINYLAFARFGYNAKLTWDQFINNDLAPLLGGEKAAREYLALLEPTKHQDIESLKECLIIARKVMASLNGQALSQPANNPMDNNVQDDLEVHRRWTWLQNYLHQKLNMKQGVLEPRLKKKSLPTLASRLNRITQAETLVASSLTAASSATAAVATSSAATSTTAAPATTNAGKTVVFSPSNSSQPSSICHQQSETHKNNK